MGEYLQILIFIIAGIVFLWFGFLLFFGKFSPFYPYLPFRRAPDNKDFRGKPGDAQVCPVCSFRLMKGDRLKSKAFPSANNSVDRIMYIHGCYSCLEKDVPRKCPVCKIKLSIHDYLVARMFLRRRRKNHIHVLGCNICKRTGSSAE
jgi:hypothetical protein